MAELLVRAKAEELVVNGCRRGETNLWETEIPRVIWGGTGCGTLLTPPCEGVLEGLAIQAVVKFKNAGLRLINHIAYLVARVRVAICATEAQRRQR